MKVVYKGRPGHVGKSEFYCKAGPHTHKWRTGWVLRINGEPVLGDKIDRGYAAYGAARYDWPEYRTRKALLETIDFENRQWEAKRKGDQP